MTRVIAGRMKNGVVVGDEIAQLPEGTTVLVYVADNRDDVELTPEEDAELEDRMAEIDRGEPGMTLEEVREYLDAQRATYAKRTG